MLDYWTRVLSIITRYDTPKVMVIFELFSSSENWFSTDKITWCLPTLSVLTVTPTLAISTTGLELSGITYIHTPITWSILYSFVFREDISHIFDENAYENLTEYSNSCVNIASGIHADVLYADTGNVNGSIIHTVVGTRIRQVKKI